VHRIWCLENRLFLNPLNDIGTHPRAASDVLHLPAFRSEAKYGPLLFGLINQMKIEFATARLQFFEALLFDKVDFDDEDILMADTLDYQAHSLGVEKLRTAFRTSYSVFDKIAFFLNFYLGLKIPAVEVNFRRIWLEDQKRSPNLKPEFQDRPNWALRGLYWLSRDLQAHKTDNGAIDPHAKDLTRIRNHIEHRHLMIHDDDWVASGRGLGGETTDGSSYSIDREDFTLRSLRLLKLARSALIYLVFAVCAEETSNSSRAV
jgi:hypothetical protein